MESHFGQDFSQVQVHTDATAASAARQQGAQAYTHGHHIVFGAQRYQPHTPAGKALLAHELTHVVQQRQPETGHASAARLEQEADINAARLARGQAPGAISAGSPGLQRRPIPRFEGTPLGELTVQSRVATYTHNLVAEREVVPPLEAVDSFGGFATQSAARSAAQRHPNIVAIIRDRDGLFHGFDTQFPPITQDPDTHVQIIPFELRQGQVVEWVNVEESQPDQQVWERRADSAHSLYQHYRMADGDDRQRLRQAAAEAYVSLMMAALAVPRDQIYIVPRGGDRRPGMINFDIDMSGANGEAGIAGSLPATRTGEAPPVTLTLGVGAIRRGGSGSIPSRASIMTNITYRHEAAHVEHAQLAIDLRQQWRESGATTSFEDWLRQQQRRGHISRMDYDLALEQVRGGEHATQTVAYLEGFITGFQQLPVDTVDAYLFGQLGGMASHWAWAGHELNDRTITALENYYCRVMDNAHRDRFSNFVDQQAGNPTGPQHQLLFYERLQQAIAGGC